MFDEGRTERAIRGILAPPSTADHGHHQPADEGVDRRGGVFRARLSGVAGLVDRPERGGDAARTRRALELDATTPGRSAACRQRPNQGASNRVTTGINSQVRMAMPSTFDTNSAATHGTSGVNQR